MGLLTPCTKLPLLCPRNRQFKLISLNFAQVEAAPGNVLEEAKKLGLNTLLSLVNTAGLTEQVTDSKPQEIKFV